MGTLEPGDNRLSRLHHPENIAQSVVSRSAAPPSRRRRKFYSDGSAIIRDTSVETSQYKQLDPGGKHMDTILAANIRQQTEQHEEQRDAFIEKMLQSTAGLFNIFTVYLGDQLGYYQALAEKEWMTSTELAEATNANERYTREWLAQQTVAGILEVEDATADALRRRFRLPSGPREGLVERESLNYLAPLAQIAVGAVYPI